MSGTLVVLTGASGSGKTAIAAEWKWTHPDCDVYGFDTIGIPSAKVTTTFGTGHQPGRAWQRAMTLKWFERIAPVVNGGHSDRV